MAPKKAEEVVESPPVSSEEEESGSSGEESESSAEVPKKVESSQKPESDSEGESESESSSGPEPESEPAKTIKLKPVGTKPIPETSGSAATVPESSTAKRPLKEAAPEAIKKQKTSDTEHVKKPITNDEVKKISSEDAKKMFQRLFSETDEIALLQGIIDFTSTKGDPYEDIDAFCIYVKKLIDFDATKNQIVTKLQRLKKKFNNAVKNSLKKGKTEDDIEFAKDLEQKGFELSRKIWGSNGVLVTGKSSRKKVGGTPAPKEMKIVAHSTPKKQQEEAKKPERTEAKVVNTGLSIGKEIASFLNADNGSSCGLDESTLTAVWAKVADGAEKREVEEKWKKLKAKQFELCLQRSGLVNETAKMIFKAYES
ncbi:unnamed protein product [Arabidopsis thaliana]|uniref:Uncharacterized protein n=1 Tax=Arabidopsis thaliana TaxID=3702 RepID=A0A654FSK0_ARATH|nr:unnamed protein product [Arabidopsis thaliana]